jgi:hypothetical protein
MHLIHSTHPHAPCSRDDETNQTVIEGMGELHLEIIVDRLRREFNVECDVGAPQVSKAGLKEGGCIAGGVWVVVCGAVLGGLVPNRKCLAL